MSKHTKDHPVPEPGQLLRPELLGSLAVHGGLGENDRGIEAEVIDVQGLSARSRFTFRPEEILGMETLPSVSVVARRSSQVRGGAYIRRPA